MSARMIIYENIPCWYELLWQEDPPSIGLKIHRSFIENKKVDFNKAPIVKFLPESLRIPSFKGNFNEDIGFGGILKHNGEKDGFVKFLAEIPKVKKRTDKKCADCHGTGKRKWDRNEECLFCEGSGWQWVMGWKDAYAISASFTVFTGWLEYCKIETLSPYLQLLTVQTITREGMHGGSLSGDISIPMREWMESLGKRIELTEMIRTMKISYDRMFGLRDYNQYSFNAYIENGRFVANCPGDRCGLYPSDWYARKEEGFEFSCHNVDSPAQQITLLAGLGALHNRARKEIK